MVPAESLWIALAHLLLVLGAILTRKPSLVLRKGEWYALLQITQGGPLEERPRTTRPIGKGAGGRQTGASWAFRNQLKATYAVPLGTRDRGHAEAILKLVLGQVEGPLPTPDLQVAREIWLGVVQL